MTVFNPIITQQGQAAAFNAQASGTQLVLTHMAYGTGAYNPTGAETALKAEVKRVPIGGGSRITDNQIRIASIWASSSDRANITEIGFYAGTVLLAVISRTTGGPYLYKTPGSNLIFSYDWVLNLIPIGSISIKVDPDAMALLVHIADTNAHPQYLTIAEYQQRDNKNSVRIATTANIPSLSGLLSVDGVTLVAGDRVLVKNQVNAFQNGIYIVAAGAWFRAPDADTSAKTTSAMMVSVEQGAANFDSLWQLTTNAPIVLGATNLVFEVVSGPSGVEAGTYNSVTVDTRGRVTYGANPTTLNGYRITDAYTKDQSLAGFVKQGGGAGMLPNSVMLGWDKFSLIAQVDKLPLGNLWYSGNFNPALKQERLELVAAISAFPLSYAPAGWLKCNGAAVSRIAYADLFARIGTAFGGGDGVNTFNLPDYRGEFLRGFDDSRGLDAGRALNSTQPPMMLSHNHGASSDAAGWHGHTGTTDQQGAHSHNHWALALNISTGLGAGHFSVGNQKIDATTTAGAHTHNLAINGEGNHAHNISVSYSGGSENRPRNISVLYCIKY